MDTAVRPIIDRRRAQRSRVPPNCTLRAIVRPGREATVIDISPQGALIETAHRLLPNSAIELQLETPDRRTTVRGRLIRCCVARVFASAVRYQAGVHFESSLGDFVAEMRL